MNGLINFSSIPLKIGFILGMLSMISGAGLLAYQLWDYFVNNAYYHLYKWIVVVLFMFIGFLFMLVWILGEYTARIFDEVRQRPVFVVDQLYNFNESHNFE